MPDTPDVLKLRILLCFLQSESEGCTVTGLAKTLGEEKYTISRMLAAMEKEQLLDRANPRRPRLTKEGAAAARHYAERVQVSVNHLLYEGVDLNSARSDAICWALYCTEQTMQAVKATEARYRLKSELREKRWFGGESLCRRMAEGTHRFPFVIYRETAQGGNNISMANDGFEHPCELLVQKGSGIVQIRTRPIRKRSGASGEQMQGRLKELWYQECGEYVKAERSGDIFCFPASALSFQSLGGGEDTILHGTVALKMECMSGSYHKESMAAIFTTWI